MKGRLVAVLGLVPRNVRFRPKADISPSALEPGQRCEVLMSVDSYEQLMEQSGISLDSLGVADIAFTRRDALKAVEALQADERLILGGDAYFRHGATVSHALANWYVERKADESDVDLLRRSWDVARRFITQHGLDGTDEALFSFVVEGYSSTVQG